jgi:poly-beta-1,6-N-acetyl-D-glucosamine synthase
MITFLLVALLVVGVNTLIWTGAGLARLVRSRLWPPRPVDPSRRLAPADVAIITAAHNEALTIRQTIRSARAQVGRGQVFIVSDGSTDRTAAIARRAGARVLEVSPNRGKAGALVVGIRHFRLAERFEVVLLLDADTQLAPDYLATGLPLFDAPDVVAVAGRATTLSDPRPPTWMGRLLVAYRERVYVVMQYLYKFGQAGRFANVVAIVPGFASMYRSRILDRVDIDAPGLAIEDYNMTFEVHAKRLGRIAFHPGAAIASTQDPDRLRDYFKQVRRWNLGFWQTVGRHGFRPRPFWFALGVFIAELLTSSAAMLLVGPLILVTGATSILLGVGLGAPEPLRDVTELLPPWALVAGVLGPDAVLTLFALVVTRRWRDLAVAPAFPLVRALDAYACLRALVAALVPQKGGVWSSPTRRPAGGVVSR